MIFSLCVLVFEKKLVMISQAWRNRSTVCANYYFNCVSVPVE